MQLSARESCDRIALWVAGCSPGVPKGVVGEARDRRASEREKCFHKNAHELFSLTVVHVRLESLQMPIARCLHNHADDAKLTVQSTGRIKVPAYF